MIYFNGEFLPADQVHINPADRGFLLGDGIFETIPVFRGTPFKLMEHLERLKHGARLSKINIPYSLEIIQSSISVLINKNVLSNSDAVVRITLTRGPSARGLSLAGNTSPTLVITVASWISKSIEPARVIISDYRRNEFSVVSRIKSLNFLENILAKNDAEINDAQDAIFLNTAGNLSEATAANLFLAKENKTMLIFI